MPLLAYGIGPGDAVFVPSFTFTATAEAILLAGAAPVFVDVEADSFNIDLADLERKVSETRAAGKLEPKAILAVDLFGLPADWDGLNDLAQRDGLRLISDAAQSFGGVYHGKRVGSLAPVSGTSFFPAKPLGCYGDGGAIFTNDDSLAEVLRSIRVHGAGSHRYEVVRIGINGRLDSIQAAILSVKLSVFNDELAARERSSADSRLTNMMGALRSARGRYKRSMTARPRPPSQPIRTRSGCVKSRIAEPSRRNSGFEHTANSMSGRSALRRRSISLPVPTGTVDFVVITKPGSRWGASSLRASKT